MILPLPVTLKRLATALRVLALPAFLAMGRASYPHSTDFQDKYCNYFSRLGNALPLELDAAADFEEIASIGIFFIIDPCAIFKLQLGTHVDTSSEI